MSRPAPFGAYVHIPFCSRRCDYCAFATWTDRDHLVDRYLAGLATDIGRSVGGGLPPLTSVFVATGVRFPDALAAELLFGEQPSGRLCADADGRLRVLAAAPSA